MPVTAPFAFIPVIPNFPFFYVVWRAWSHWKAWKGAAYLESLLKLGFIREKESEELSEIYAQFRTDETPSSGRILDKPESSKGKQEEESRGEVLPEQARGEGPAPDGTSTPKSMVYQSEGESSTQSKSPPARHPSMMIGLDQVQLLAKAFDVKQNEVMDVNRAVEQADLRAKKRDAEQAIQSVRDANEKQKPEESGTTWRGNLHR